MGFWEIVRSVATVASVLLSIVALFMARRDQQTAAQKTALTKMENDLTEDIEALKGLMESRRVSTDQALNTIQRDISTFREAIQHMPTVRDIDQVQNSIAELAKAVAHQQGTLESNTRMCERMNQFLMEKGT